MFKQIKLHSILTLSVFLVLSSMGCKKAVPIITGEADSNSPSGPQANFYIYPAGAIANNGNNQQARVLIDAKVGVATNNNGANQQIRAQILSR